MKPIWQYRLSTTVNLAYHFGINIDRNLFCDFSMTQLITLTEYSREIVTLTLNRPERCNAFSYELLEQFSDTLNRIERDQQCRIVILRGAGKMFCTGLDLAEAMENTSVELIRKAKADEHFWLEELPFKMASFVSFILIQLRRMPQIIVCAPHGFACGGGGGLVAASDLVVAADDFKIMFPELKRGLKPMLLFPLLRRKLSDAALRQMILTGMPIDAQQAKEFGLVHYIVKPESLDEMALFLAKEVCAGEPETVQFAKKMLQSPENDGDFELFKEEMLAAIEQHTRSWYTVAAKEGVAAFLEKRVPNWDV